MNELQIFITIAFALLMSCALMLAYLMWYVTSEIPRLFHNHLVGTFSETRKILKAIEKRERDDE